MRTKRNEHESSSTINVEAEPKKARLKALSPSDMFDSRKVVVRIGDDHEPAEYKPGMKSRFEAFYFHRWLTFDGTEPRQYAECSQDSTSILEDGVIDSKRRYQHLSSHSMTSTIPLRAVYFIHHDLAQKAGLNPDPGQDTYFPELITKFDKPIQKPFARSNRNRISIADSLRGNRIGREELPSLATVGNGLEVRISRIPKAGRGVYALKDFSEGQIVTLYFGHPFGERHRRILQDAGRGTHAKPVDFKHKYLDGVKTVFEGMHAGQLLNQGTNETINCEWATLVSRSNNAEKILAIRATRDIYAGEELYISYGKKYWDELEETPNSVPRLRVSQTS